MSILRGTSFAQTRVPNRLATALLLSLVLHAALWAWTAWHRPAVAPAASFAPIEIAQIPDTVPLPKTKNTQRPQVVETEKSKDTRVDPSTPFLGERNQTVTENTAAATIDDFRVGEGTGSRQLKAEQGSIAPTGADNRVDAKQMPEALAKDGVGINTSDSGVKRDWKTLSMKDLSIQGDGLAAAATDDSLENVRRSDRTLLSTREFKYYSYYHRIKDGLRQHWKPNVERRLAMLWQRGQPIENSEMVTRLVVTLRKDGNIDHISRVSGSGFEDIDQAAIDAFEQAAPFPNPPAGMVEADGLVRLQWDFVLRAQSAPAIRFRRPGRGAP